MWIDQMRRIVNENDVTRKHFEVLAREVFKKVKACVNNPKVNAHRVEYQAINIVYRSLQQDRDAADITAIIRALHQVVDEAIDIKAITPAGESSPLDISQIDFDRLRKEFERHLTAEDVYKLLVKDGTDTGLATV